MNLEYTSLLILNYLSAEDLLFKVCLFDKKHKKRVLTNAKKVLMKQGIIRHLTIKDETIFRKSTLKPLHLSLVDAIRVHNSFYSYISTLMDKIPDKKVVILGKKG